LEDTILYPYFLKWFNLVPPIIFQLTSFIHWWAVTIQ